MDSVISLRLTDPTKNPKLFEFVKTYQQHKHSKIFRKYKNTACRFHVDRYVGGKSIIAKSLPVSLKEEEKADIMTSRDMTLTKVKEYIDREVDQAKIYFYYDTREDFRKVKPNERSRNIRIRL